MVYILVILAFYLGPGLIYALYKWISQINEDNKRREMDEAANDFIQENNFENKILEIKDWLVTIGYPSYHPVVNKRREYPLYDNVMKVKLGSCPGCHTGHLYTYKGYINCSNWPTCHYKKSPQLAHEEYMEDKHQYKVDMHTDFIESFHKAYGIL